MIWMLGCVPFAEAWALQKMLAQPDDRDRLLLLSHPHTFTVGTSGDEAHVLWNSDERARHGVALHRIDRGGDVTYHGPGQLVGYPILHLGREGGLRLGVVDYLRKLESVIIRALDDDGIVGFALPGLTGVWVSTPRGDEKIAAIGVRVTVKAITQHGFAINLNTNLRYFTGIVPCGIEDRGVTSLARVLGHPIDEARFAQRLCAHFGAVFEREMIDEPPSIAVAHC